MIEARDLTRRFGRVRAVNAASFQVPKGRVAGFLGPNGAGKTTTLKMLSGLLAPSAGQVQVGGLDPRRDREEVLSWTGALVETPGFFDHLTALENLVWIGSLGRKENPARIKPRAMELLKVLGLERAVNRRTGGFSTGMRMRLALCLALLHRPKLLLLDEPTTGLDPEGRRAVRDQIGMAARDEGATVLVSSHLLEEIEVICDWLVVIHEGRVIAQGELASLLPATGEAPFSIRADPPKKAMKILSALEGVREVENAVSEVQFRANREQIPDIVEKLVSERVRLRELRDLGRSLEDFYMAATGEETSGKGED